MQPPPASNRSIRYCGFFDHTRFGTPSDRLVETPRGMRPENTRKDRGRTRSREGINATASFVRPSRRVTAAATTASVVAGPLACEFLTAGPCADDRPRLWTRATASGQGRNCGELMLETANAHRERRAPRHRALTDDGHGPTVRTRARSEALRRSRRRSGFRQVAALADENRRARRAGKCGRQALQRLVDCDRGPAGRARDVDACRSVKIFDQPWSRGLLADVDRTFVIH